ncbi:MAG: hypothetical protein OCD01_08060 [Fibrobacterales bacterium]
MSRSFTTVFLTKTNKIILSLFSFLWVLNGCLSQNSEAVPVYGVQEPDSSDDTSSEESSAENSSETHISSLDFSSCDCAPEYGVPYSEYDISSEEDSSSEKRSSSSLILESSSSLFMVPLYGIPVSLDSQDLSSDASSSSSEMMAPEYGVPFSENLDVPVYGIPTPEDRD